ncbi:MAG: hypothetical protein KDG50_14645 [Chromatiales bacterium]|nr:hypothetical protein [Chromatiales bacterium]
MAVLLTTTVTDELRQKHDTHRAGVVAAVLGVLLVYMYLFTYAYELVGLPAPKAVAEAVGMDVRHVFDDDGNVDSNVEISDTQRYETNDDERLVFLLTLVCAFLSAYFLPLGLKQASLVVWASLAIALLFGVPAALMLLAAHVTVFLTLHPRADGAYLWGAAPGLLVAAGLAATGDPPSPLVVLLPAISAAAYQHVWLPILAQPRAGAVLRTIVMQAALITVCIGAIAEGFTDEEWKLPVGILFFFWQWERLLMYHADWKDGTIPEDITLWRYLPVFVTPAAIPNIGMRVAIGQGYSYIDRTFLCEDKNRIVAAGIKLLLIAMAYLILGHWARWALVDLFEGFGIEVYNARITEMIKAFHAGEPVSTASVLTTTLLDLVRWVMVYASVAHFKVGVWRICGYRVDPSFDKPWMATNLVTFWARFTFHYREFLGRIFYYPVFFRYFRKHRLLRIVVATLAAVTVGNLIWGHMVERFYYAGIEAQQFAHTFATWPYFVLLGLGIGLTEVYLVKKKRKRKPWTPGAGLVGDVIATYCTLQFYALIHIFIVSRGASDNAELFRLFLTAFGIHIPA